MTMKNELREDLSNMFGLTASQIDAIAALGAEDAESMQHVTTEMLTVAKHKVKLTPIKAAQIVSHYNMPAVPATDQVTEEEIAEGANPTPAAVSSYANTLGMDQGTLMTFLLMGNMGSAMGAGAGDFDMSSMLPVPQIVGGYSPKIRNMPYLVMGQIERRLGTPIVVINDDGSVNAEQTVAYIMSLEEGFPPAVDGVWYDPDSNSYEVIKVGVDAQSIYDADPVNPTQALPKSGIGTGRISWNGVPLDVRQVVFLAATQTREVTPGDESKLAWLRDHIKPGVKRLALRGEFPAATTAYNQAARMGALPTMKVQLSRQPRRPEVMPRRRTRNIGEGGLPGTGNGFHDDEL